MRIAPLSIIVAFTASVAQAGTITAYSDFTSFDNATGPLTIEDFGPTYYFPISSGVLDENTTDAGIPAGLIEPGVTFSTQIGSGNFFNIDLGGNYTGGFLDSIANSTVPNQILSIAFETAQSGFGFITNEFMSTFDITINFSSGGSFSNSYTNSSGGFVYYGFTSDLLDISSVVIDGTNGGTFDFSLDDFAFTNAPTAPVPLPAALPLLLVALGGLGFAGRRRKAA